MQFVNKLKTLVCFDGEEKEDLEVTKRTLENIISIINKANGIDNDTQLIVYQSIEHERLVDSLNDTLEWLNVLSREKFI